MPTRVAACANQLLASLPLPARGPVCRGQPLDGVGRRPAVRDDRPSQRPSHASTIARRRGPGTSSIPIALTLVHPKGTTHYGCKGMFDGSDRPNHTGGPSVERPRGDGAWGAWGESRPRRVAGRAYELPAVGVDRLATASGTTGDEGATSPAGAGRIACAEPMDRCADQSPKLDTPDREDQKRGNGVADEPRARAATAPLVGKAGAANSGRPRRKLGRRGK